jgi:hypothetical protein
MKLLRTEMVFLPERAPVPVLRECLRLVFEEFKWFRPAWYGFATLDKKIDPENFDYRAVIEYFENHTGNVMIAAQRKNASFLLLSSPRGQTLTHLGELSWSTMEERASQARWRDAHKQQVEALMRLFDSPLATAASREDYESKAFRWVDEDVGQSLEPTVRDCSEGLAGLLWRNFYGEPFVRLFGERLEKLPPEYVTRLGEGRVLVQPYELPGEAGSDEARARERQLIQLLGPECFYDPEHHEKPTRKPELAPDPPS